MNRKLLIIAIIVVTSFFGWGGDSLGAGSGPTAEATSTAAPSATATPAAQPTFSAAGSGATEPKQIWNWHVQNTDVYQGDWGFPAKYSGPQSLNKRGEAQETVSLDLFAGLRLWRGAELHLDGLMWQGFGLSNTFGIEAFPSGDSYKFGTDEPYVQIARLFIRQTIGFGGEQEDVSDDQLTLAGKQDISRLTLTVGRFTPTDIFDINKYANDAHTQFMNWALVTNLAWDYPADTVGYTTGLAVELNQANCAVRYGFFQMPSVQNGLTVEDQYFQWRPGGADGPFLRSWGMLAEFERRYSILGHPGAIRFMPWLNEAHMASYHAATSILVAKGPGANISAAQAYRYKYGFGLNWEQEIAKNVGAFSRLGWNDGHEEGWVYTDANWTASVGASIKGEPWHRSSDTFGVAGILSGASHQNQEFLKAGGLGILAGDGTLNYRCEKVLETYYDLLVWGPFHTTVDYQFVSDPAFNRARGPVSIFGIRIHWQL